MHNGGINAVIEVNLSDSEESSDSDDEQTAAWQRRASAKNFGFSKPERTVGRRGVGLDCHHCLLSCT